MQQLIYNQDKKTVEEATFKAVKEATIKELNQMYRHMVRPQEYIPCPNCDLKILGKGRLKKHLKYCNNLQRGP